LYRATIAIGEWRETSDNRISRPVGRLD